MERSLILYIAMSLDGYIAGPNGELDWLFSDQDYGYYEFIKTIDTVLIGRKTYDEILDFDVPYPYDDKKSYVFTTNPGNYSSDHDITFTAEDPLDVWKSLKEQEGRDVWLVGGGKLINPFVSQNEIDQYIIAVHPIILGKGIELFRDIDRRINLETEEVKTFDSGLVQLFLNKTGD